MKQPVNTTRCNAALYMRLSRDDKTIGESASIETQRKILRNYAKENHLNVVGEYVDDGWSGTNFNRPDFQRMIGDIEAGKVNCVVTKDLSRFGREHVAMGYYLEFMFPEHGVRYIAVTENEDSDTGLSDFVPFKNMFNEWYAKDTSRKIKAALRAKYADGQYVSPLAPFGYRKHPTEKNKLVVDEETSWIVEKIFSMALQGYRPWRIAQELTKEGIPTPGSIKAKRIECATTRCGCGVWYEKTVRDILRNEVYIGNAVHGRRRKLSYKSNRLVSQDKENWVVVQGTHDPIVSKDVFDVVQKKIGDRVRVAKKSAPHLFSGILKCADCGRALTVKTTSYKNKTSLYYVCRGSRLPTKMCTGHSISHRVLCTIVLSRIQYWIRQANIDEDRLLRRLEYSVRDSDSQKSKTRDNLLAEAKRKKEEVDSKFVKLYEDYASGRITEYNFSLMSNRYQEAQSELDEKIQHLISLEDAKKQDEARCMNWVNILKSYTNPTELTRELLTSLVEKIVVHEAVKGKDGKREREIEIFYRFVGQLD